MPSGLAHRAIAATAVLSLALLTLGEAAGAQQPPSLTSAAEQPTLSERVAADKAPTSQLAETDPALLARTDRTPIRVMIKLDYDSMATYQGGVAGLEATSPSVTGRPLNRRGAAEQAYDGYATQQDQAVVAEIQRRVPEARADRQFHLVYGGISAVIPADRVEDVLAVDGVVAVQENRLNQPLTDSSPEFIGAPTLYDELGTDANAGQGVIYGNLDTGIWPEHPSFADLGNLPAPPGPARECNYGDNPLTPESDPFSCQNKLIGGAHFTDTYDACAGLGFCIPDPYAGTARDGDGHGTHTSSTSAGNLLDSAVVLGVDRGAIQGIAPGAYVMEYKVCGPEGCFSSDSAAAVEQAILDGVDVINFSISGGEQPFTDPVELAFLDAYAAGVFVSASAGNSGPGAGTANHLSPWTTTVGASTQSREFAATLTLDADNGDTFVADGASITAGAGPLPVVLAGDVPGYADPLCGSEPPDPEIFDGLIVACERGVQARVWKSFVVFSGGGEGMVLYNPALADNETDNHWLPTVHLADGTDFVAFMNSHTGVTGSFPAGDPRDGQGDVMAAFSSRGPAGNFIKPDITAPGVQILAGASPTPPTPTPDGGGGPPDELFQAIAGTSMSSPHSAGSALLLRALHPDWTPGQVRSAMMTTATTDVVKEDLVTPADPFDMGAGRVDLNVAGFASLTFDESPARFFLLGNDPVNAVHLNLPSVNAPVMPGRLVTTRMATNVSGVTQLFETSAESTGGSITVSPRRFALRPNQSVTLTIAIESEPTGSQQLGAVHITSNRSDPLHLPVAFVPTQGGVNLTQDCTPLTIPRRGISECVVTAQNNSFAESFVDLRTTVTTNLRIDRTEGATQTGARSAELLDVPLAGAVPGVPSVGPGELFGYLPLDDFGVSIEPIGDEEILNFSTSPINYAGVAYNAIGVDSNGYIIMGGGVAEDNNCCNLPSGPDPARPNNMLAPFWTDLNGLGGANPDLGILAAALSDGVSTWIVVEFRLVVFGTDDLRTFQVWLGVDGVEDITYAYAAPQADPAGQDFLVGAENQLGQGDMEAVLPTEDLRVTSSAPTPGASVSYSVFVQGLMAGTGRVTSTMEADTLPGTTVVTTDISIVASRGAARRT
ncbi:MAG: S8 family serine peptidase [Acidimicrobiales bacterium]